MTQQVSVDLPQPVDDDTVHPYWAPAPGQQVRVAVVDSGERCVSIEFSARWRIVDVADARAIASALLAAADAAEHGDPRARQ